MLNEDVYGMALHLAGELTFLDATVNSDYRERAGYLLPVICRQCEGAENACRRQKGLEPVSLPDAVPYSMRSDFPLSAPLATVVALGLASLLSRMKIPPSAPSCRSSTRSPAPASWRSSPHSAGRSPTVTPPSGNNPFKATEEP